MALCELFPIVQGASVTNCIAGVTIGFLVGLGLIYGLEVVAEYLENLPENGYEALPNMNKDNCSDNNDNSSISHSPLHSPPHIITYPKGY